ncbi:MAG: IS1634 family transposase, partial [Candidatus Lambdaproteobacteria bacterium]|nr:IS1634 family transposase [Candidatus Lambdaproteobacteria bacterium]
ELARLWHDLDTTVPAAIDELGSLRAVALTLDTARCLKVPQATGLAQHLLDAAGVRLPQALPARSTQVATRKPLAAGRK